jgi:hypothetical protein
MKELARHEDNYNQVIQVGTKICKVDEGYTGYNSCKYQATNKHYATLDSVAFIDNLLIFHIFGRFNCLNLRVYNVFVCIHDFIMA